MTWIHNKGLIENHKDILITDQYETLENSMADILAISTSKNELGYNSGRARILILCQDTAIFSNFLRSSTSVSIMDFQKNELSSTTPTHPPKKKKKDQKTTNYGYSKF